MDVTKTLAALLTVAAIAISGCGTAPAGESVDANAFSGAMKIAWEDTPPADREAMCADWQADPDAAVDTLEQYVGEQAGYSRAAVGRHLGEVCTTD